MPADSLLNIAHRACEKYIRLLSDIGQCPIELVESILIKIDNPDQLRKLEENSPQVVGHTKEAWIHLLRRDVPNVAKYMPEDWESTLFHIDNADRWHKIYNKVKRKHDAAQNALEAELAAKLKGMRSDREKTTAQVTAKKHVEKPNRFVAARYNMNKDMFVSRNAPNSNFFDKLNRNAVSKASAKMRTPTHRLKPSGPIRPITKAPMSLVEELRAKKDAPPAPSADAHRVVPTQIAKVRVPQGPLHKPRTGAEPYDLMQDREARLRNLKSGRAPYSEERNMKSGARDASKRAQLTEDFLEDDGSPSDDIDDEELFGDPSPKKSMNSPAKAGSGLQSSPRHVIGPVRREKKALPHLFHSTTRR